MNNILKRSTLVSGLLIGLIGMSGQALAHLPPGGVVIDFEDGLFTGPPESNGQMPAAVFPSFGNSYIEDGVVNSAIGFGTDPGKSVFGSNTFGVNNNAFGVGGTSHLHGNSSTGSRASFLEPDSGGGFFHLADGDAFSVAGLDIASLDLSLVGGGFSTATFRGYSALNGDGSIDVNSAFDVVVSDDGSGNPIDAVGGVFTTETGAGINGTHLHLDDVEEFGSIFLLEYFFDSPGRGNDPATTPAFANLGMMLDNVELGPEVSAVPVPAAVYLFGTALLGLTGMRKKMSVA